MVGFNQFRYYVDDSEVLSRLPRALDGDLINDSDIEEVLFDYIADIFYPIDDGIEEELRLLFPHPITENQRPDFLRAYTKRLVLYKRQVQQQLRGCATSLPPPIRNYLLRYDFENSDIDQEWANDLFDYLCQAGYEESDRDSISDQSEVEFAKPQPDRLKLKKPPLSLTHKSAYNTAAPITKHQKSAEGDNKKAKLKSRRIWNHLTISRDETASSEWSRSLLAILFSSRPHLNKEIEGEPTADTINKAADLSVDQNSQLRQQDRIVFQQQQAAHLHHKIIEVQAARLHQIRQKMPNMSDTQKSPEAASGNNRPMENMLDEGPSQYQLPTKEGCLTSIVTSDTELNKPPYLHTDSRVYQELMNRITSLETENQSLKAVTECQARAQILHFIIAVEGKPAIAYLDEPTWSIGPKGEIILTAHFPITDITGFLSQKHDIAFVVARYYSPQSQEDEVESASRAKKALPQPRPSNEHITLQAKDMVSAAEEFFAKQPNFAEEFPGFNIRGIIPAPYLFWYHYRSPDPFQGMSTHHRQLMGLLTSWIEKNYGEKYDLVDKQLENGVISQETMSFLTRPGDVLVWEDRRKLNAAIVKSWPVRSSSLDMRITSRGDCIEVTDWAKTQAAEKKITWNWTVDSWHYEYDGQFLRKPETVQVVLKAHSPYEEVPIQTLNMYPMKYASSKIRTTLEHRGKTFWSCRHHKLVSYEDQVGLYGSGERFMVDFETYRQLHCDEVSFQRTYSSIDDPDCEHIASETMASDEPPPTPDIYVFPDEIPGYDLKNKKWVDLKVDQIKDVTWNKRSFEHLVVDNVTKELVQALVVSQIANEQGTDIIERKGKGLIILLHGGPGTGKTFTAESVAELAEKPLFRVTCGDIGTEPEKVEKYLESVLHLGKAWDCVVLIDEAEVFLEQRSLDNLERNALVSVFLRVLEYYEGILILTSNRVGTFDEAFKSRILLSLHYENLTRGQRTKIWKNFLGRLKAMDSGDAGTACDTAVASVTEPGSRKRKFLDASAGIDFHDIDCYIDDLANYELNGRQIRNIITAGRQYANFKKERMAFHHLKHVIDVSSKFETYLKTVQEGYSDDQIMRTDGIR